MKKKTSKLFVVLVTVFTIYGFTDMYKIETKTAKYNVPSTDYFATVPQENKPIDFFDSPVTGKSFVGFKEALAFKESQGKYDRVNTYGYLGKYQFGKGTLKRFKIYDTAEFLKDPELQEDAFLALCSVNKWILKRDIKRFVGKRINGVKITESGILAAAHLAGAGNVKIYLRSYGQENFEDAYGSSISYYIKKFAGYDTSFVEANRHPVL
ncbi:peptidoglycan-binding protein LysM [Aureibaculum sp. 2210JD6-5]|uniref:peptidoglycan-binding protein LysM n=1 Tax=Aureibaculum sp. 2210JD6-5 TaxID=3103957 RepID=UPI002AAE20FE|nr:peptidoglycan-binding protein LysM [Aureibaculum sp. 2210JD6-5]MDY7393735.1 peptidoglycan-binding protein LysM [Aureibaculum sp. 2210JD6-5]